MAILDYLEALGVSDCYASPLFQAGPQSTHGYDICDFNVLNPVLGTAEQFKAFTSSIRSRNMGLLLDMVPNHMGCDCGNPWWWDVLANGRESAYADYFDINWSPAHSGLRNKVLLPILEDHYGKVLESGKLRLVFGEGGFRIVYYESAFPLSARSTTALISELVPPLTAPGMVAANLEALNKTLADEARHSAKFQTSIEKLLEKYRVMPGDAASSDQLHALLDGQHYKLAYWKTGLAEINYRRFFDVTSLVSVRMERPEVFEASHRLVFQMIASGQVTGLRIDHPDGLWDPKTYFERLQNWGAGPGPLFVVAEKILSDDEELPEDWPVAGTTGYDFLNRLNGLFVARENRAALDHAYRSFTGIEDELQSIIYAGKEHILATSLKSELTALAHRLRDLGNHSRHGQDITLDDLREAVAAMVITSPVYRSYVDEETHVLRKQERAYIQQAIEQAKRRRPGLDAAFDFLGSLLLLQWPRDFDPTAQLEARHFVMRFQQLTGPVMAKGLEDTAFYRYNRLVSLNEVGGNPGHFGTTIDEFHRFNEKQAARFPNTLLATATHDTKRGEDLRARLNVISELPADWSEAVEQWSGLNQTLKRQANGRPAPTANDEYLLYQTILGAWPNAGSEWDSFRDRVRDYMLKAVREAKAETNWLAPNLEYEQALAGFVDGILEQTSAFVNSAGDLQKRMAFFGRLNSLSQTVLKLTCPGVPDVYQGTELWDLNLVDPDNRRPVDYAVRRKLLSEELSAGAMTRLLADDPQGQLKLHVVRNLLHLRRRKHGLFANGSYRPLSVSGPLEKHVFAFSRCSGEQAVIVVTSRLACTLVRGEPKAPVGQLWANTFVDVPKSIPQGRLMEVLAKQELGSGGSLPGRIELTEAFATLPVAVMSLAGRDEN